MKIIRRIFTLIFSLSVIAFVFYLFYALYLWGVYWIVVVLLAIYICTAIWALILFIQKRHLAAKTSWFLIVILIPVVGIFIYLIFGRRYKGRKTMNKFHEKYSETYLNQESSCFTKNPLLLSQNKFSKTSILNADLKIYDNGMYAFKQMYEDLEKAQKFIHLNFYIIKSCEVWEELKEIFIKKIKEGVEVRLIVDDFGRWALPWYELKDLRKKGLMISIYDKVSFPFISSQNGVRSHRKYISIDGKIGYTGGVNLANEYANYSKHYGIWEDLVMRVRGQGVRALSLQFINDWKLINEQVLDIKKYAPIVKSNFKNKIVHIEDSPEVEVPIMQDSLVHWISNAKESITLSTPYFVPSEEINSALRKAILSGVEVKIFLPGLPDKKSAYFVTIDNATLLEELGAKIFILNKKFLHTKAGIFDGKTAYLGTMNIDIRSFRSQFENISLFEGEAVDQVKDVFLRYEKESSQLVKIKRNVSGIFHMLHMTFLKIIAPMM